MGVRGGMEDTDCVVTVSTRSEVVFLELCVHVLIPEGILEPA